MTLAVVQVGDFGLVEEFHDGCVERGEVAAGDGDADGDGGDGLGY